jgi:magnesium-protoporphyrin O-methyltransferase
MMTATYLTRRQKLTQYFDETAAATWARITSNEPLGRIRATVRAGRDEMRGILLDWLPARMDGMSLLDAGCGTGSFAIEAAQRGAHVVALDISGTLVRIARERTPAALAGRIDYSVGDMLEPAGGPFDYVVAMDSLIHYAPEDKIGVIAALASQARCGMLFTFAPRTAFLAVMHAVGRAVPRRHHRAPEIEPIAENRLRECLARHDGLQGWTLGRTRRVQSGFYVSQAMEMRAP